MNARKIIGFTADISASYAVGVAMVAVMPELSIPAMIGYRLGTMAIGAAVGRFARKNAEETYDEVAKADNIHFYSTRR